MKILFRLFGKKDRGQRPNRPGSGGSGHEEPRPEDQFERMAMNLAFITTCCAGITGSILIEKKSGFWPAGCWIRIHILSQGKFPMTI